jgi:serine/threonine protein kinase
VILVAKRFKEGDKHKRRADALQEVLMGGLNHRGIIGALAMTIQDPPRLVYDYYNGGDLASFIDKCDDWRKKGGKSKVDDTDFKFIQQRKLFLENRLGIALALLETMQYLHAHDRVHCDFHFGNILLHFDYDSDVAVRVYVGICDFGMSKHLSQCQLKEQHIWAVPLDKVAKYRKDYPQLAPKLVGPNPTAYSKKTDVYSMGNIFETLLQAPDNWDGMTKSTRYLSVGWKSQYDGKRLDDMISAMMDKNPVKRMDCEHWALHMHRAFPDCKLRPQNSPYLRD